MMRWSHVEFSSTELNKTYVIIKIFISLIDLSFFFSPVQFDHLSHYLCSMFVTENALKRII